MLDVYRKIFDLLSARERRKFALLVALTMVMGLLEVLGVASVLPFLAVVSNPEIVQENRWLALAYDLSGSQTTQGFLIVLGVGVFLFVLFTTLMRAGTIYLLTYFTRMRMLTLASQLMERYLSQPYVWFLSRHSSDLGKSILSEVGEVVNGPIASALRLLASAMTIFGLVVFLLILQPSAAIGAALLFGGCYGLIFLATRAKLSAMGEERYVANRERFMVLQEAMGGIKNVKIMGLERSYLRRFYEPARRLARNQAALMIIAEMPRHLLEVVAFGGMILFVLWLLASGDGSLAALLPILGVYAFAAARMFPTIQVLFASVSIIRFGEPALNALHAEMTAPFPGNIEEGDDLDPIPLHQALELCDVRFAFPDASGAALDGLTMRIPARSTVGIVGPTGAGKTTTVDMILGLLAPQSGNLVVDGTPIDRTNVRAWQRSVGYVPQEIFLVDDTVAANIAFGVPQDQIDYDQVRVAAKVAALDTFVESELPDGYDTVIGEGGTRLSGGQRQRIGIARAIYRDPDLLVFDEATSALDNLTERAVIEAVKRYSDTKTIIMIAHRLSTVKACDTIFLLEKGRLSAANSYDQLVKDSAQFRALHEATT